MSFIKQPVPAEIWLMIFSNIDSTQTIAECRLLCKSLKPLVDRYLYKTIEIRCNSEWSKERVVKLTDHLASNPELCHLIQTVNLNTARFEVDLLEKFLKIATTTNIRALKGYWQESTIKKFLYFLETSNIRLDKLQELPKAKPSDAFINLLHHFKKYLKSASLLIEASTNRNHTAIVANSLGTFSNLITLDISSSAAIRNIQELDNMWKACSGIKHLTLSIAHSMNYTLIKSKALGLWLEKNVQTSGTTKSFRINMHSGWKTKAGVSMELLQYSLHKCPNLDAIAVHNVGLVHQDVVLPNFSKLQSIEMSFCRFEELNSLVRFVEAMKSHENSTIQLQYNTSYPADDSVICEIHANKKNRSGPTDYKIRMNGSDHLIDENTKKVMPLFSTWKLRSLFFLVGYTVQEKLMSVLTYFPLVECLTIDANEFCFEEPPQQFQFKELKKLDIWSANIAANDLTNFCNLIPKLQHLALSTCSFEHQIYLPDISLISLTVEAYDVNAKHDGYEEYEECDNVLFHVIIAESTHLFIVIPDKSLLHIPIEDRDLYTNLSIEIECKSLQHLKVDLAKIKFDMEFESSGEIRSSNSRIEKSRSLQNIIDLETMREKYRLLEERYSRARKVLTDSQIRAIEEEESL